MVTREEEEGWWRAINLNTKEPRTYQYDDMLVEIEDEIAKQERLG